MPGVAFLLKVKSGNETPPRYTTVAGLRVKEMNAGPSGMLVTATGIFLSNAAEAQIRRNALSGTIDDYELSFEDGVRLRGRFLVQRLDYSGDLNGERSYTLTISSAGEVSPA